MMGWYDHGMGPGGWILMTLLSVAFWAFVVVGVIALYRATRGPDERSSAGDREAQRLLDQRFARGDIDAEDYQQRRDLLRSGR